MGRKPGPNSIKIGKILSVLAAYPDGIWLREIARQAGCSHATVSKYLNSTIKTLVLDECVGRPDKPALRFVRLKPFVFERLQEGKSMGQIMRMLQVMESIK